MLGDSNEPGQDHDRLFELILRLSSRIDQPTLVEDILCSVASLWNTGSGALLLEGGEGVARVASSIGLPTGFNEVLASASGSALLAFALENGEPKSLDDLAEHPQHQTLRSQMVPDGYDSACFLPLMTPSGAVVGALALYFEEVDALASRDLQPFTLLGPLLAQYIFTARAHALVKKAAFRFRSRAKKLNGLAEACASLATLNEPATILPRAVSLAMTWMSAEGCTVDLLGLGNRIIWTEGLCRTPGHGCGGTCSTPSERIRKELLLQLVRTRAPVVIRGANAAQLEIARALDAPDQWDGRARTSLLCLPLISAGELIGAMTVVKQESSRHDPEEDLLLASEIARHTAMALSTMQQQKAVAGFP